MKKDNRKILYFTAEHTGSLKETLDTEKSISKNTAIRLIETRIYEFYSYDERINCYRFILNNFDDLGFPTWLHVYRVYDRYIEEDLFLRKTIRKK